jgi:hypothetical protein
MVCFSSCIYMSDNPGWHASYYPTVGNVDMDNCPGPRDAPGAYPATGHNRGPNTDEGTLTNLDLPAQVDTWRNVGVIVNAIVVVHSAAGV